MKPRILCDCDGVIADFTGALCADLKARGHGDWNDSHLDTWELKACLPKSSHKDIDAFMTRPGSFSAIPRYDGAQAFYKRLRAYGDVVALTTVRGPAQQERYDWLVSFGFADPEIILVEDHAHKVAVPGDAIIDDRIETLRDCRHRHRILFDRPWNQGNCAGMIRCRGYDEVLTQVRTLFGVPV